MEKKICSKCKIEKDICEFTKRKNRKSGYSSHCKMCISEKSKVYREKNNDLIKNRKKKYYEENKEKLNKLTQEWYKKNSKTALEKKKEYYLINKEHILDKRKTWVKNNRKKINDYIKNKKKENPLFRVEMNIRGRMKQYFKQKNITQKNQTFHIVDIDIIGLKKHIETQFKENMTWDNYGIYGWHIDHIVPLCSANNETELLKLFHYTNLQPLWCDENLRKNGKILI
jgi:hypothetical protein